MLDPKKKFGTLTSVFCLFDSVLVPIVHQVPGFGT